MRLVILAPSNFNLDATALLLRAEDIDVAPHPLGPAGQFKVDFAAADTAAVVVPTPAIVNIGEPVAHVRSQLGAGRKLLVCCPDLSDRDRRRLTQAGDITAVAPRGWAPTEVAERILAELILDGGIAESGFGAMRGATKVMRRVYSQIRAIAALPDTVLILGETGTGKELIAQRIHRESRRAKKPLKSINCAGLNENTLESELFGHVHGAFTGAVRSSPGYFVAADGGTLFLDEIGDMPLTMQVKLLRALEQHEITPMGSTKARQVDVRVLAATHANLATRIEEGRFREDLYYRLNQWVIEVPPLREHRADIPLLVNAFLAKLGRELRVQSMVRGAEFDPLFRHGWPGNVRELYNVVRNAAARFAAGQVDYISFARWQPTGLRKAAVRRTCTVGFDPREPWDTVHDRVLRQYLRTLLRITGDNQAAAAKLAGRSPTTISDWRRRLLGEEPAPEKATGDDQ